MDHVRQLLTKNITGDAYLNSKMASLVESTKKKAGAVLICGALVATVRAGAAWAENSITTLDVKVGDGVTKYFTYGGKTLGKRAPEGVKKGQTPMVSTLSRMALALPKKVIWVT